jgi:hypothetical protein
LARAALTLRRARGGSQEALKRARARVLEILGSGRGLSAKLAQFLAMSNPEEFQILQDGAIPPLPFDEVLEALDDAYGVAASEIFTELSESGLPASVGQVHFGRGPAGEEVAIKLRYPGIVEAVKSEVSLLGWIPAAGPARQWGFDLAGYRKTLGAALTGELDYEAEAQRQIRYRRLASPHEDVIVPEVIAHLCRPDVLVQSRENGISLEEACRRTPGERLAMGRAALRHVLRMAFRHGFVHADPNPANFAFRPSTLSGEWAVVLYDYGCVLELDRTTRLALLRTILALQTREPLDVAACLAAAGFEAEKLRDLGARLPPLLAALFEPFLSDAPFDAGEWRLGERADAIAGDLKWWFRSAAPARLILLMRIFHGLVDLLVRLDARVCWKRELEAVAGEEFAAARALAVASAPSSSPRFDSMATRLRVRVERPGKSAVELSFPARAAEDFQALMDADILTKAAQAGIDAAEVQRRLFASGMIAQSVFELQDDRRKVLVWLE